MDVMVTSPHLMEDPSDQIHVEDNKDSKDTSNPKDLLGSLTKVPTPNVPRVSGRPFNKDKIRCFRCKEFGHMQKDCPELNRPSQEDIAGPKKFEDYTYTYSGPDVQPPLPRHYPNQQMATNYDQALGAIKDSLSTANPLASLNL